MKIRKVKSLTVVAMLAATIAGWWNGYSANDSKVNQLSGNRALLSEDVEALSQEESPNSKHYTWAPIDCGELVSYGGKQVFPMVNIRAFVGLTLMLRVVIMSMSARNVMIMVKRSI